MWLTHAFYSHYYSLIRLNCSLLYSSNMLTEFACKAYVSFLSALHVKKDDTHALLKGVRHPE